VDLLPKLFLENKKAAQKAAAALHGEGVLNNALL
jgi:hypothetical protein